MRYCLLVYILGVSWALAGQTAIRATYQRNSINGELTKLSKQLPPGSRERLASYDHVVATYRLTHVAGVSRYEYESSHYLPRYTGEQFPSDDSSIYYKDLSSDESREIVNYSSKRGCQQQDLRPFEAYTVTDSTKVFGKLLVQKAVHRTNPGVVVWFAPGIPVRDGPRGLAGFPGLVTEYIANPYHTKLIDVQSLTGQEARPIVRLNCPPRSRKD